MSLQTRMTKHVARISITSNDKIDPNRTIIRLQPGRTRTRITNTRTNTRTTRFNRTTTRTRMRTTRTRVDQTQSRIRLTRMRFNHTRRLATGNTLDHRSLSGTHGQLRMTQTDRHTTARDLHTTRTRLRRTTTAISRTQTRIGISRRSLDLARMITPITKLIKSIPIQIKSFIGTNSALAAVVRGRRLFLQIRIPSAHTGRLHLKLPIRLLGPSAKTSITANDIDFVTPRMSKAIRSVLIGTQFPGRANGLQSNRLIQTQLV